MDNFEVKLSRESIYDIADISEYIELRFGFERAEQFDDEIQDVLSELSWKFKHNRGTGIYYRGNLILKKVFKPSIIFYFVDDIEKKIYVVRVLRHERDWQKILRETTSYTFD